MRSLAICALIGSVSVYIEPSYVGFHWPQAIRLTLSFWLLWKGIVALGKYGLKGGFIAWVCTTASILCDHPDADILTVASRTGLAVPMAYLPIVGLTKLFGGASGSLFKWRKKTVRSAVLAAAMDYELFRWGKQDPFTLRELLMSAAVFGQSGSGKSSGSGLKLARGIIGLPNSGGLILASKPEDRKWWEARFREAGRATDLLIFDDSGSRKFNVLQFERASGGDALSITHLLMVTAEALGGKGDGDDPFWKMSQERFIYLAVQSILLAGEEVTIEKIQKFINQAPISTEQFTDPALYRQFEETYHHQTMMKASGRFEKKELDERQLHDWKLAKTFWTDEYTNMDAKPRTSVIAGLMNILHNYNTGFVRDLISTTTNVSPKDMEGGKWVIVDLPIDERGPAAKIIMHAWKYSTQKHVLRRHVKSGDGTIGIYGDEYHQFFNSFDSPYLATCRSHLGYMITLTQSLFSFYKEDGENKAKEFLTNFHTKIAHTIGDADTAKYLCSLVGQHREGFDSYDTEGKGNMSEKYEDKLKVHELLTGLRSGQGGIVDGIVIKSGVPFSTGENFLKVEFTQK